MLPIPTLRRHRGSGDSLNITTLLWDHRVGAEANGARSYATYTVGAYQGGEGEWLDTLWMSMRDPSQLP